MCQSLLYFSLSLGFSCRADLRSLPTMGWVSRQRHTRQTVLISGAEPGKGVGNFILHAEFNLIPLFVPLVGVSGFVPLASVSQGWIASPHVSPEAL